jgi:hypothetical protein
VPVAVSASNGDPRQPGTLHHISPGRPNEYEQALAAVGSIVCAYDHDGLVPAYGFGARFPNGVVSHCFSLTGQPDANCRGIPEIEHYYKQAIGNLQLYGPTNFSEFIQRVSATVREAHITQQNQQYFVLLVLTDGCAARSPFPTDKNTPRPTDQPPLLRVITDMDQTISAVVAASGLPLSIIIVGVGSADFTAMERLDADTEPLRCPRTGRLMERDIVQFVSGLGPEP